MRGIKVVTANKKNLVWPSLCVLCLKSDPEEEYKESCGDKSWVVPYCRDCYRKMTRFNNWGENFALYFAGLAAFIAGAAYLATKIIDGGWSVLLCLDGDVWGMAALAAIVVGFAVWLLVTVALLVIQPCLPSLFPHRYSHSGAAVKTGISETGETVIEEVEFAKPDYAEKFRQANGLKK